MNLRKDHSQLCYICMIVKLILYRMHIPVTEVHIYADLDIIWYSFLY